MRKILGLVSSQRKQANGEILIKEVAAAAGDNCQLKLLRLADLNLELCRGCYTCLTPDKQCPLDDGLYYLVEQIKDADGIILSAPCYAMGPAAVTKVLGDRIIALAQIMDQWWGKPCVVVATAGIQGWEGYTSTALNTMVRLMGFDLKDSHMFMGALPGEGVMGEGAITRARKMGQALFGQARPALVGECPTCWSEAWRFNNPETVVCTICGQTGSLVLEKKNIRWEYGEASNLFEKFNLEECFHEKLRVKVKEFIARRKELAEVRDQYKGNDIWLRR
ncbi:MAG: NAD(P)H-dependent oxidoreductase [Clostridia bacterium]|nr:NAD(P)H-dependent oxidoreductase [Clostridia bacterium]